MNVAAVVVIQVLIGVMLGVLILLAQGRQS